MQAPGIHDHDAVRQFAELDLAARLQGLNVGRQIYVFELNVFYAASHGVDPQGAVDVDAPALPGRRDESEPDLIRTARLSGAELEAVAVPKVVVEQRLRVGGVELGDVVLLGRKAALDEAARGVRG